MSKGPQLILYVRVFLDVVFLSIFDKFSVNVFLDEVLLLVIFPVFSFLPWSLNPLSSHFLSPMMNCNYFRLTIEMWKTFVSTRVVVEMKMTSVDYFIKIEVVLGP